MDQTNSVRPHKSNTCASVVTYHPDDDISPRVRAIACQVDKMIIVDNHSDYAAVSRLAALAEEIGAELIINPENMGLARALNQALHWADSNGYSWILTMDQDSTIYPEAMETYSEVWKSCPFGGDLALIGGNYVDSHNGSEFLRQEDCRDQWNEAAAVITSGSLLCVSAARKVGGFREDFFVDQVDFEYCLRARSAGYQVVISRKPVMSHVVSAPVRKRFMGRTLSTPNTPALRRYYMVRNHFILAREYLFREPEWVLSSTKSRAKEFVLMMMLEEDRMRKAAWTLRGLWDGVCSRMGRVAKK